MTLKQPDATRQNLLYLFKRLGIDLRGANIEPGLPRFRECAPFLFLKLLGEHARASGKKQSLWKSLKREKKKIPHLNEILIPLLRTIHNAKDVFTKTAIAEESIVQKIIDRLDAVSLTSFESDVIGDAFEYFLGKGMTAKQDLGQYFTPRPLVNIMVDLVSPTSNDTIYDPFCGAGGLLVGAFHHMTKKGLVPSSSSTFFGKDVSASTLAAKLNALLHWDDHSGIEQVINTLQHPVHQKYSIGLTNVPFARDLKNYPYNEQYENGLARNKTDVLCFLHLFQAVQKGGRIAAIVPEGFLLGTERAQARKFLADNADLKLVVSLPHSIFSPYTHVKTALIYLENIHCPTRQDHFWYFDVESLDKLADLKSKDFNAASEDERTALGYIKVPFEKIRAHHENWIGKHYETHNAHSPYPLVPLGNLVTFLSTGFDYRIPHLSDCGIPLFTLSSVKKERLPSYETKFLKYETPTDEKNACAKGDILVAVRDTNRESELLGKAMIANRSGIFGSYLVKLKINATDRLLSEYLYYCFQNETYAREIKKFSAGSIVKSIRTEDIAAIKIPLPPLVVQEETVKEITRYKKMIASQNEVAHFFHEKCRERLNALWG